METHVLKVQGDFELELGEKLNNIQIQYHTSGKLNQNKSNVVWVFHALTANSDCENWWSGLIGEKVYFNPKEHFIVCANILGSCYGSTGATSVDFPLITIRDMVNAHRLVFNDLGLDKIKFGLGGSMGGYQLQEWAFQENDLFENLILIATSPKESAWGIAIHEAHRQALKADPSFEENQPNGGKRGLKAARSFGMIQYRSYDSYRLRQIDQEEENQVTNFRAASYIDYHGTKFVYRFNPYSYYCLLNAMDTHDISRNRKVSLEEALAQITAECLVIGIDSDYLCPPSEQKYMAEHLTNANYVEISSNFGHDGFLVESEQITNIISRQFNK